MKHGCSYHEVISMSDTYPTCFLGLSHIGLSCRVHIDNAVGLILQGNHVSGTSKSQEDISNIISTICKNLVLVSQKMI